MKAVLISMFLSVMFEETNAQPVIGNDYNSKFEYATEMYSQGKYARVIEYCTDLESHRYSTAEVFKLRAMANRAIGNYEKAAKDYGEAVQLNKDPQIMIDRAEMFICMKEFDRADQDFNEAKRLMGGKQSTFFKENYFITEEIGCLYEYMGDYREAIGTLKFAIDNGSTMAQVDVLGAFLREGNLDELRLYSSQLLQNSQSNTYSILSDSSLYCYVKAMNELSAGSLSDKTMALVDKALSLRSSDIRCFQGFSLDLLNLKARVHSMLGQDSSAYLLYKKLYSTNNRQDDVKQKMELLKIKLGINTTPPKITIINPPVNDNGSATLSTTKTKWDIYGKVTDSSGIASVTLNNMPVTKIEDDGIFVMNVDLNPGSNEIVLTAIDKEDNKVEKKFTIDVIAQEENSNDTMGIPALFANASFHAILIGEKNYVDQEFLDLENPIKNINELKEVLVKDYEFDEKNVIMLPDATRQQIIDAIQQKADSLKENDNLLIFYAGHGTMRNPADQSSGYLIPADATKGKWQSYIASEAIETAIRYSSARHILFILDACFSGAMFRSVDMDNAPPNIKRVFNLKSRKYLSSGNKEQVADNSIFFENLTRFLKMNTKHYTTADQLAAFVKAETPSTVPQYNRLQVGDEGGEFIFVKRQ